VGNQGCIQIITLSSRDPLGKRWSGSEISIRNHGNQNVVTFLFGPHGTRTTAVPRSASYSHSWQRFVEIAA
jgi:hypothetical protein